MTLIPIFSAISALGSLGGRAAAVYKVFLVNKIRQKI